MLSPLFSVSTTYLTTMSGISIKDWTIDYYLENKQTCDEILKDVNALRKIPSLNSLALNELIDGQLVRFQGMIQDMNDPEYYYENFEVKNLETGKSYLKSGMYRDIMKCGSNEELNLKSTYNKRVERQTFIVISTPGLNEWAKELKSCEKNSNSSYSNPAGKRSLEDDQDNLMDISSNVEPAPKREKPSENKSQVEACGIDEKPPLILSKEFLLNFPIPNDGGKSCIVKIYSDSTAFKLNQVIDVVGFISMDLMLSLTNNFDEYMSDIEVQTHYPPASIISRLHAIVAEELSSIKRVPIESNLLSKAEIIRSDLHMVLSQLLFGDNLAADYLICHLISSVYSRKDYLCLGNFPLNITHFPKQFPTFPKDFYNFLTSVMLKSYYFECTLDTLNDSVLVPKKDYEADRLTSGILQLSDNTHLIIDETNLTIGQISASGRLNYEAIRDLIKFQKLTYDFQFYTIEYETDIPVLILSQVKSFIPCLMQIRLKSDPETESIYAEVIEAANQFLLNENRLNNIRYYLESCRKGDFVIGEDISDVIQEDFVQLRKSDKSVNADNLHSLIVFSRLMAISHGENSLTVERWKETFTVENERVSRLPRHYK